MPTAYADVAHLLRRAGFGGTPAEINALAALDLPAIVDRLLDTTDAPPVTEPPEVRDPAQPNSWWRGVGVHNWWLERMRTTPSPLIEKMALFWHGHFATSIEKLDDAVLLWEQHLLIRQHALGSFRDLVRSVSLHPALLLYLDNEQNVAGSPNENFARELMELFTLGLNQYTQDDVVAAARAWTGHGYDWSTHRYVFRSNRHDTGLKTFFGITRNWDGPQIIDEILTGAKKPVAASFIARKLWTFLAYPDPEPALVDALATEFAAAGLDVAVLLRAIFLRPEFYSAEAKRGLVRSPVEFMVAAMKATNLPPSIAHPEWWSEAMGQMLLWPPDVSGWKHNDYWVSTSAMLARADFARFVTWMAREHRPGFLSGIRTLSPASAVQRAFDAFGLDAPAAATRSTIESWLTSERAARGWGEHPNLITLTMLSPDFQVA
jgi:uncharacterized protein (DUF1800 family)